MKTFLAIAAMLFINLCTFAQTDPARIEQDHIFQYINKGLIPTGFLNEYGPETVKKLWLTGVLTDSNHILDIEMFNFLYNDIENSRINTTVVPLMPLDSVQIKAHIARFDSVSQLVFISADYAELREDAVQQNLFTANNNQVFDVAGRTQTPYILKHVFGGAPVLPESLFRNEIRIIYKEGFYGNTGKTISLVQVDFLDGSGYQSVYLNSIPQMVAKTYTDVSGYKKFAVKITYSDNTTDHCYTGQIVKVDATSSMLGRYSQLSTDEINNPKHVIQPTAYLNVNPTIPAIFPTGSPLHIIQQFNQNMKIYIRYSATRVGTNLADEIVKPFIIVEGYDITDASKLLKPNNYNINSLLDEWDKPVIKSIFDITKKLDEDGGYDLIL